MLCVCVRAMLFAWRHGINFQELGLLLPCAFGRSSSVFQGCVASTFICDTSGPRSRIFKMSKFPKRISDACHVFEH